MRSISPLPLHIRMAQILITVALFCFWFASASAQTLTCSRIPNCVTCNQAKNDDGLVVLMCRTCEQGYRPAGDGLSCECATGYYYQNGTTLDFPAEVIATAGWSSPGVHGWRARQSSVDLNGVASRAIDGNTDPMFYNSYTCTHTTAQNAAWWALDMGKAQNISGVIVHNRGDCCSSRLRSFDIRVGNIEPVSRTTAGANPLCKNQGPAIDAGEEHLPCNQPLTGRYISIQMASRFPADPLTLCEVIPVVTLVPSRCIVCPAGQACPGGSDPPLDCGAGMMTLTSGARSKDQCVAQPGYGFYRNRTFDATGAEVLTVSVIPCPPNYYNAGKNQLPCRACPGGLITVPKADGSGATSVKECVAPSGFAFDKGIAKACARGTYKGGASTAAACTKCPAGLTTNSTGSTSVADCYQAAPGYLVEVPGVSAKQCPRSTYNEGYNNATNCTQCEDDKVTINLGSKSSSSCLVPPGYGFDKDAAPGSKVKICPVGWWKSGFNLKPCAACGDGLLTQAPGATSIQDCMIPRGYGTMKTILQNGTSSITSVQCLNGTYGLPVPSFGVFHLPCRPCSENMGTLDMKPGASANKSDYINAGFDACVTLPGYGWDPMYKASKLCSRGTYSSGWSLETCYACPEGHTTTLEGSLSEDVCQVAPGYYLDADGQGHALPCSEGSYCPGFNVTEEQECPNGTWSLPSAKSAEACDVCIAGYGNWVSGINATERPSCSRCPPNTYSAKGSVAACTVCPPAHFSAAGSDSSGDCYDEWQRLKKDYDYLPVLAGSDILVTQGGGFESEENCTAACTFNLCVFYQYNTDTKECFLYSAPEGNNTDAAMSLGLKVDLGVYTVYAANAASDAIGGVIPVLVDGATANAVVTSDVNGCMRRCDEVENCVALLMTKISPDGNMICALRSGAASAELRSKYRITDGANLNYWFPAA